MRICIEMRLQQSQKGKWCEQTMPWDAVNKKGRLPESSLHFVLHVYFAADALAGAEAAA